VQPRDGVVATWIGPTGCDFAGMQMIPHDEEWDYKRNVQGMVDFEKNAGTQNMVHADGGVVTWPDDKWFESFAVCMAREDQHFTPKEREDAPLLMFRQKDQKNKLGKRCALVELALVDA
jgi:hypothetical protein